MEVTNRDLLHQFMKRDLANLNTGTLSRMLVALLQLAEAALARPEAVPSARQLTTQDNYYNVAADFLYWAETYMLPSVPMDINVLYSTDPRVCGTGVSRPAVVDEYRTTDWPAGPIGNVSEAHDFFVQSQGPQWLFRADDPLTYRQPAIAQHVCGAAQDQFQDGANACSAIITQAMDDIAFNVQAFLQRVIRANSGAIRYAVAMQLRQRSEMLMNAIEKMVLRAIARKAAGTGGPGMAPAGQPDDVMDTTPACARPEPPIMKDVAALGNRLKEMADGTYAFTFAPSTAPASVGLTVGAGIWTVRSDVDAPVHAEDVGSRAMCIYDSHNRASDGQGRLYMFWWVPGSNQEYIVADYVLGVVMGHRWQVTKGVQAIAEDTRVVEDAERAIKEAIQRGEGNSAPVAAMRRMVASRVSTIGALVINVTRLDEGA